MLFINVGNTFTDTINKAVAKIASLYKPTPTDIPSAEAAQISAALVSPNITSFFLCRMAPAPKKPIPLTICAASLIGSILTAPELTDAFAANISKDFIETIVIRQLATEITIVVFKPRGLFFNWRSIPINNPSNKEIVNLMIVSITISKYLLHLGPLSGPNGFGELYLECQFLSSNAIKTPLNFVS